MRKRSLYAITTAGLMLSATAANANLLTNGSFETPVVQNGSFTSFAVGSTALTGWTVFGPSGTDVAVVSGALSQAGITFDAEDGNQYLDLTGDASGDRAEGVSQSVSTIAGDTYQLSFFVGNAIGGGIFGPASTVLVLLNGTNTATETNSNSTPGEQNWEQFTVDFVATGLNTSIGFENGDSTSDNNNGLDNVVLNDLGVQTTPVPEPAPLGLLGASLFGLAWLHRRRVS